MAQASDDRVDRLLATLNSSVALVRSSEQQFWADWIESAGEGIAQRDPHGLDHLLGAYGGMGSLNDLYLGRETDQFYALKQAAWSLAGDLRAELLRP